MADTDWGEDVKKKLGLSLSDDEFHGAIATIGEKLKGVGSKNGVTVYDTLADHFGKLSDFA